MPSSEATETDNQLSDLLTEIREIDGKIGEHESQIDTLKHRRSHLEKLVCEEMVTQRIDGLRVAGRSWRIEFDHLMSVPEARRDAVLEAAQKAGWAKELTTVNTARLKALLKEQAKEAGVGVRESYSDGTPFAGLVGEVVVPKLRHLTVS